MKRNAVADLKRAVVARDPVLAGPVLDALRMAGFNYRQCYRVALAADPALDECAWEDFMADVDDAEGGK